MGTTTPSDGAPSTTDQPPRWERPQESKPRGYMKAEHSPDRDEDAVGETNANPQKTVISDALKTKDDPNDPDDDAKGQHARCEQIETRLHRAKPTVTGSEDAIVIHLVRVREGWGCELPSRPDAKFVGILRRIDPFAEPSASLPVHIAA